jgi:hypothetical protein
MTYLFPAQIQKYYFDLHGIEYKFYKVSEVTPKTYTLIPHDGTISNTVKPLIEVYDGDLNDIDIRGGGLTKSWYEKATNKLNLVKLKNNIRNFFRGHLRCQSKRPDVDNVQGIQG